MKRFTKLALLSISLLISSMISAKQISIRIITQGRPFQGVRVNNDFYITADDEWTICQLKKGLQAETGIPVGKQMLIVDGNRLNDDEVIRDYGLRGPRYVALVIR